MTADWAEKLRRASQEILMALDESDSIPEALPIVEVVASLVLPDGTALVTLRFPAPRHVDRGQAG